MNKIFTLLFLALLYFRINAQAPDFVISDIYGQTYHLYDELDNGKQVLLVFYGINCQSCRDEASGLDSIWQDYNQNTWLWGIESNGNDSAEIEGFKQEFALTYPMFTIIDNDSIVSLYNVTYTPTHYVICPDKTYRRVDYTDLRNALDNMCTNTQFDRREFLKQYFNIYTLNHYICYTSKHNTLKLYIYDIYGRKLFEYSNISEFKHYIKDAGIYIIKTYINGNVYLQKVLIR